MHCVQSSRAIPDVLFKLRQARAARCRKIATGGATWSIHSKSKHADAPAEIGCEMWHVGNMWAICMNDKQVPATIMTRIIGDDHPTS